MTFKTYFAILILTVSLSVKIAQAQGDVHYYSVPLRQLNIEGSWPDQQENASALNWMNRQFLKYYLPYAVGEHDETIYLDLTPSEARISGMMRNLWQYQSITQLLDHARLAIQTHSDEQPGGTLYLPRPDLSGMIAVDFTVPEDDDLRSAQSRQAFYTTMKRHYEFLIDQGFTGGAWFRYRAEQAQAALDGEAAFDPNELLDGMQPPRSNRIDEGMALFTGARAVSENIQLDRQLQTRLNAPRTIAVDSLTGITTAQIDWQDLIADAEVEKDPLAGYLPADQHVILYPTFKSMVLTMDELKSGRDLAMPLRLVINQIDQYEQQMCVWLDGWSRFWGPKTIRGVAMTGSDPYMESGTDSAVLFDARATGLVYSNFESKQDEKLKEIPGAREMTGTLDGIAYRAVVSPDRAVSSYLAKIDNVVVVTNSLSQLEKIVRTAKAQATSIAKQDEYTYFRSRYPLDADQQTAFLVMSDAAIRRWCGPRWRIGAARRAAAAAILSYLQADYLARGSDFDPAQAQQFARRWMPELGDISLTEAGVTSSVYGNLRFMTPIIELAIDNVSEAEREQYRRFRQNYQRQWQLYFDPIAVSVLLEDETIDVDLTVRPLVAATVYGPYIRIAGDHALRAGDGDVHPQTLLQLILAVDPESDTMRQFGGFAMQMMNQDINALSWMGRWVTLYADDDPFWKELAEQVESGRDDYSDYLETHLNRFPLAAAMEVDNPAKLTLFLISLRAFIQQTAPDMTTWENLKHADRTYVKVTARHRPDADKPSAVYYAILPDMLVVSFHEDIIKRAIDRAQRRADGKDDETYPWLGQHLAARVNEDAWPVIETLTADSYGRYLQMQAWNNLPILTEWHRRAQKMSETTFHEHYWFRDLAGPDNGKYTWNSEYQTMESSVFGQPGQPKRPKKIQTPLSDLRDVQLGITFEADGLRARTVIERED